MPKFKHVLVTCARWDADRIAEWLNYYRSIGYEHAYVYSNDDDPTEFFEALLPYANGPSPFVTYYHYRALGMQRWTLVHCLEHHGDEFEWISQFDIDEYLCIRKSPDINTFVSSLPEADSIYVNWLFFGNNNHEKRQRNLLLNYTRCQRGLDRHTKTITRRSVIKTDLLRSLTFRDLPSVAVYHGWKGLLGEGVRCINPLGHDMSWYYDDFNKDSEYTQSHAADIINSAALHHYAFQSATDNERRLARGTAGEHAGQTNWGAKSREEIEEYLVVLNSVENTFLKDLWQAKLQQAWTKAVLPLPDGPNFALKKPCWQSSTASNMTSTAHRAVDGQLGFKPAFETDAQIDGLVDPFWDVDLGEVRPIKSIMIFNRLDEFIDRSAKIVIWLSNDRLNFHQVYRRDAAESFGGVDGNPLVWRPAEEVCGRFVRVSLAERKSLHLAQVEVY